MALDLGEVMEWDVDKVKAEDLDIENHWSQDSMTEDEVLV